MVAVIDFTIATINSGRTIGMCLGAILCTIPVKNIIIVDGVSHENALEICKSYRL